jgi:hypothetical protein
MFFRRRVIAVILLTLFSCQMVLASVVDPCALYSDSSHVELNKSTAADNVNADDLDSSPLPLTVQECEHCCSSAGHCHFLSLASKLVLTVHNNQTNPSTYDRSYQSLPLSIAQRPPIKA